MQVIIESMQEKGFTYLGCIAGKPLFCNLNSEESVSDMLIYLESITNEKWKVFQEQTGNDNLVFYKDTMYEEDFDGESFLHYRGNGHIELPLNCSSCYCMFSYLDIDSKYNFGEIDSSKIVCMDYMFFRSELSDVILNVETDNVDSAIQMFKLCKFNMGFSFGDKFTLEGVENTNAVFNHTYFCDEFVLNKNFGMCDDNLFQFESCKLPNNLDWYNFNSAFDVIAQLQQNRYLNSNRR